MHAVRQAVPRGWQEPEVLLRMVRERGAQEREQAAVDVYLGTRSESGREVNAMRAALAQGRRI